MEKKQKDRCEKEGRSESVEEAGGEVKVGRWKSRKTIEGRANRRRKDSFAASYEWYR